MIRERILSKLQESTEQWTVMLHRHHTRSKKVKFPDRDSALRTADKWAKENGVKHRVHEKERIFVVDNTAIV